MENMPSRTGLRRGSRSLKCRMAKAGRPMRDEVVFLGLVRSLQDGMPQRKHVQPEDATRGHRY